MVTGNSEELTWSVASCSKSSGRRRHRKSALLARTPWPEQGTSSKTRSNRGLPSGDLPTRKAGSFLELHSLSSWEAHQVRRQQQDTPRHAPFRQDKSAMTLSERCFKRRGHLHLIFVEAALPSHLSFEIGIVPPRSDDLCKSLEGFNLRMLSTSI